MMKLNFPHMKKQSNKKLGGKSFKQEIIQASKALNAAAQRTEWMRAYIYKHF